MAQYDGEYVPFKDPRLSYPCGEPPSATTRVKIADGVYWLRRPLPFDLEWINVWLLEDDDGWTLVDTGIGDQVTKDLWDADAATLLEGKPITRIICTHMHPDHMGCAGFLSRKYKAPLHMSALEYTMARLMTADTGKKAPQEAIEFYRRAGWTDAAIERYESRFGMFGMWVSAFPENYVRLREDDVLKIGERYWRIVTGNGHSPDHVCLWDEAGKLFISGDQIIPRISSNVSVQPTEPFADPLNDWINSCSKLLALLPADILTLPAHNEPFLGARARLEALLSGHAKKLDRVLSRMGEPKRVIDLYGAMFARDIDAESNMPATGETLAHLHRLIGQGRAKRFLDVDGVWRYQKT